jgi:hypothetical protein
MRTIPTLNTRETAFVAWLVIALIWALSRAGIRDAMARVVATLVGSRILTAVFAAGIAYTTFMVLLLERLGVWDVELTKTTVIWFVGTGLARTYSLERHDRAYFKRLLFSTVALPILAEFVGNLHTFPLYVEFPLVFVVVTLVLLQAVAEQDPATRRVAVLCQYVLGLISLIVFAFLISDVVHDFAHVATVERGREFLLPLLLTAGFLPFLYVVALYSAYQTTLHMLRHGFRGANQRKLHRLARRSVIRLCGPFPARAQKFEAEFRGQLWGPSSSADVEQVIAAFRESLTKRRRPHARPTASHSSPRRRVSTSSTHTSRGHHRKHEAA